MEPLLKAQAAVFGGDGVHRFSYDALDNLRSWQLTGVKDYAQYTYDGNNRLASIQATGGATLHAMTYDVQGNLRTKDGATYHFDVGNRLRAVVSPTVTETYRYDGHGRRVLAWTALGNKLSMYASNGQLMYQQLWPATMNKAVDYYYLSGSLVATRSVPLGGGPGTVAYQHTDALGSPVAVTDALGAVVERTDFDPYGNPINKIVDGVGYTGHIMDARTELIYMQQRYHDRGVGGFISVDPISANVSNGRYFGRYAYANWNGYRFADPDGRLAMLANLGDTWAGQTANKRFSDSTAGRMCELICLDGPPTRPAIGKNRHARNARLAEEAQKKYAPDTYGAPVEYDPELRAAGSHKGSSAIVLGPKAFHYSLGFVASIIQHEGTHVYQAKNGRPGFHGDAAIRDEVQATMSQIRSAERFNLTEPEVQLIIEEHESRYGPLPDPNQ